MLIREASITTIAAEDQGALDTIIGASFDSILHNTIWDVDEQLPIFGPQSAPQWQAQLALQAASPRYSFRIRQNHLYLYPAPSAGKNLRLEYMTKYPILDGDGSTLKVWITADTDTFIFPDALVMAGLRWRWKREKGLTYAEDKDRYNAMFSSLAEREVPKETISLESLDRNAQPGILVPYGNWSIP